VNDADDDNDNVNDDDGGGGGGGNDDASKLLLSHSFCYRPTSVAVWQCSNGLNVANCSGLRITILSEVCSRMFISKKHCNIWLQSYMSHSVICVENYHDHYASPFFCLFSSCLWYSCESDGCE